jgi:DNA-binding beta-propeller fold protein YncE
MDAANTLYLANYSSRTVLRLLPDGQWDTVATTPRGWYPSYGIFDNTGQLWIMQYNDNNEVKVEKADLPPTKKERDAVASPSGITSFLLPGLVMVGLAAALWFLFRQRRSV